MLTEEMKKELVERIRGAERVDKILLFGSEATGTAGPDSDIDLLVKGWRVREDEGEE